MRPFVVLTSTRSGSTWLLTLLNGQKGVRAYGEIFLWRAVRPKFAWVAEGDPERFFTRHHELGKIRLLQLLRYLDDLEASLRGYDAGGFKLIVSHLRQVPELFPLMLLRRYRMILLVRSNLFESTVSDILARMRDDPHGNQPAEEHEALALDPKEIVLRVRRRRIALRLMRIARWLWPWPSVEVDYDDLVRDQASALKPLLRTLGCSGKPRAVTSQLTRRLTRPYRDLIKNYDEIMSAMTAAGLGTYCPPERCEGDDTRIQNQLIAASASHPMKRAPF